MGQEKTSKLALTHDTLTKHGILRQDSFNIVAADGAEFVPIYEGKMFRSFNHRRREVMDGVSPIKYISQASMCC
jgi:hypothetical protein